MSSCGDFAKREPTSYLVYHLTALLQHLFRNTFTPHGQVSPPHIAPWLSPTGISSGERYGNDFISRTLLASHACMHECTFHDTILSSMNTLPFQCSSLLSSKAIISELQSALLAVRGAVLDTLVNNAVATAETSQLVLFPHGKDVHLLTRLSVPDSTTIYSVNDVANGKIMDIQEEQKGDILEEKLETQAEKEQWHEEKNIFQLNEKKGPRVVCVSAVLDSWVWDSNLVLNGFQWRASSV